MSSLNKQQCEPCSQDSKPLKPDTAKILLKQLHDDWSISDDGLTIYRNFSFSNYYETIAFVNAVAWISHQQDHHPSLQVEYKHCTIKFSTHIINGLSINDFICAAKIDLIKEPEQADPDLESSDKPRVYATEAIKLADLEPNIEIAADNLKDYRSLEDELTTVTAPVIDEDDDDEHIFNNDGEIVLEPIIENELPNDEIDDKLQPPKDQTVVMPAEDLKDLPETQTVVMSAEDLKNLNEEHSDQDRGDTTIPDAEIPKINFTTTSTTQSPLDTQTLIMSQEDLKILAQSTQNKPSRGNEEVPTEEIGDSTIPHSNHPPVDFSTPAKPKPAEPKEAQTVVMTLNDLQQATEENNPELEKTVVMAPIPETDNNNAVKNENEDTQKVDPAIEDDDTLVMHANTYERVQE